MVLIDKGYYDYDYEERKRITSVEAKPKSMNEVASMLARFGFNTKISMMNDARAISPEEAQRIVMAEIKEKKVGR